MIIGIDGNEANNNQRVGIGQFSFQILKYIYNLSSKGPSNPTDKFNIYLKYAPQPDLPQEKSWWKYKIIGPKLLWTQIALPITLLTERDKPEIFLSLTHYAPRILSQKNIVSVMDLSFQYYPETFTVKDLYQLKNWTAYSVKKAAKIITISQHTKKDIIDQYHISPSRIEVIYPGIDKHYFKINSSSDSFKLLKQKYNLNKNYLLYVGTLQPRKNIVRLIKAYEIISAKQHLDLILIGKKGWKFSDIFAAYDNSPVKKNIKIVDFIDNSSLALFYQNASCLVLPSLYEGFGLPVIEAMACGCPVVASNCSSLPEIVGNAGVLVDPLNINDIKSGIWQIIGNSSRRSTLIKKGLAKAAYFDWEKSAKQVLHLLKGIV